MVSQVRYRRRAWTRPISKLFVARCGLLEEASACRPEEWQGGPASDFSQHALRLDEQWGPGKLIIASLVLAFLVPAIMSCSDADFAIFASQRVVQGFYDLPN